ncbi:hypothetical protein B484DRAFT_422930 [Ochromonadaceae sp. CCMP2298]|nr:hypothetical protein B484DRAFT_422930 [Ochromonadaceae sp. CCMP2298]
MVDASALTVIDPSYNLAAGSATLGLLCGLLEDQKSEGDGVLKSVATKLAGVGALLFTLFGLFMAYQTTTLRFTFFSADAAFSLVKADLTSSGNNVVVGGGNIWKYSSFQNWGFLPSKELPVLVYFREDQTPQEAWQDAPQILAVDSLKGQVHYFPAIARSDQLAEAFTASGCKKQ